MENDESLMMHTSPCSCSDSDMVMRCLLLFSIIIILQVNAKDYYLTKVDHLKVSVAMERTNALTHKLPIAFVTFAKGVTPKV